MRQSLLEWLMRRRGVQWLELGAAVVLFTAFLTYIVVTYAVVSAYQVVTGREA